jgi:hypothetical protein
MKRCFKSSDDSTVEQNGEVTPHFIAFGRRLESNTSDLLLKCLDCRHVWAVEEPPNQFIVQRIKQLLGVSKCERLDGEALRGGHVPHFVVSRRVMPLSQAERPTTAPSSDADSDLET